MEAPKDISDLHGGLVGIMRTVHIVRAGKDSFLLHDGCRMRRCAGRCSKIAPFFPQEKQAVVESQMTAAV